MYLFRSNGLVHWNIKFEAFSFVEFLETGFESLSERGFFGCLSSHITSLNAVSDFEGVDFGMSEVLSGEEGFVAGAADLVVHVGGTFGPGDDVGVVPTYFLGTGHWTTVLLARGHQPLTDGPSQSIIGEGFLHRSSIHRRHILLRAVQSRVNLIRFQRNFP